MVPESGSLGSGEKTVGMDDNTALAVTLRKAQHLLWPPEEVPHIRQDLLAVARARLDAVLDEFYTILLKTPELKAIIGDSSRVTSLKKAQRDHWLRLLEHGPDESYLRRAQAVGEAHVRVGLTPAWYTATYGLLLNLLTREVARRFRFRPGRLVRQQALQRLVLLDMMLALSAYEQDMLSASRSAQDREHALDNMRQVAGTVIAVNDAAFILAELTRNARNVSHSSQAIASASEQLVSSVGEIARSSEGAAEEADHARETTQQSRTAADQAQTTMGDIASAVSDTAVNVGELFDASRQIGEILSTIQDIAAQTNLLALNATIEAARAGESGKGFAVVANEVKNLANQTSKATEDIAGRIQALQRGMDAIQETMKRSQMAVQEGQAAMGETTTYMEDVARQVTQVSQRMQDVAGILGQQQHASQEIATNITSVAGLANENATLVVDVATSIQNTNNHLSNSATTWFNAASRQGLCEMAKIDHVLFKKRVVDVIMGAGGWHSSDVPDHHACRLGKWYDGITDPEVRNHPKFKALNDPHQKVHAAARACLEAYERDDPDGALKELKRMNEASNDVLEILTAISTHFDSEDREA